MVGNRRIQWRGPGTALRGFFGLKRELALNNSHRLDAADRGRRQFHGSVLLEALACELQGAAVLGHRSDDVVRRARGYSRLDLDCHGDLRPHQADKVGNYLIGDAAGITADLSWINDHRAMKAIRSSGDRLTWGGAIAGRNGLSARSLGGLSAGRRSWPQCGVDSLLPHRDICLNKDSAKAIDRTDYLLSAPQATIPAGRLVEAFGEGEARSATGQQPEAVADRCQQAPGSLRRGR